MYSDKYECSFESIYIVTIDGTVWWDVPVGECSIQCFNRKPDFIDIHDVDTIPLDKLYAIGLITTGEQRCCVIWKRGDAE